MKNYNKKILDKNEELELMKRYKINHDETAAEELLSYNMGLVPYCISKYCNTDYYDDFEDVAIYGLHLSLETFKLEFDVRFNTYAIKVIRNLIFNAMKDSLKYNSNLSLDAVINNSFNDDITLLDIIPDKKYINDLNLDLNIELLNMALNELSYNEYTIIIYTYGVFNKKKLSRSQIAIKLNITPQYVSRLHKKALITLKDYIKSANNI